MLKDLTILDISKKAMQGHCYNKVKPKYRKKAKLCYMVVESFTVYVKSEGIYGDPAKKKFDVSNCEVQQEKSLPIEKKQIGLMKDELGGKIMKECVALRPKTYNYLTDGRCIYKKAKDTKKSNFRTTKSVWKVIRQY